MKQFLIQLRTALLVFLTHRLALPVLKSIRKPVVFDWDMDRLQALPEGTLGNDLHWFLEGRKLPLLKHYARHDLKHVLLGYDTTDEGEACLQCFMLGSRRMSFPVMATVLYSLILMPEYWNRMNAAFRKGRQSKSFHHWNWNELVLEKTIDIRYKIFNHL